MKLLTSHIEQSGSCNACTAEQNSATPSRSLNTAVLFLVFNRPAVTQRVFEAIRLAKPPRLYVAADGPRAERTGEADRCEQVRKIATDVDWPCEIKTLFRTENLGCKKAVSGAIGWFFEQETQGIILEDDCLPNPDFFYFCENLLQKYSEDERVSVITGNNFQSGRRHGEASYYFSQYNHCWGWASWRRAWQNADMELKFWPKWKKSKHWKSYFRDNGERRYWQNIFDRMYRAEIDTWDYPWTASVWFHGGLTATPNVNLVSNIGFGVDSTHTANANDPVANLKTAQLGDLTHPAQVEQSREADRYVFDHVFGGLSLRFPRVLLRLPRRLVGKIYRSVKQKIL